MSEALSPVSDIAEKVLVQETGAGRYQVRAEAGGIAFFVDEPVALGGLGSGPNPYDLLSAALAACTAMTVRLYADRKSWPLEHVAVRVSHVRAARESLDRFNCELMVEGALDCVQRERLLDIANRCPVHLTLERSAEVHSMLRGPVIAEDEGSLHGRHMAHMVDSCAEQAAKSA